MSDAPRTFAGGGAADGSARWRFGGGVAIFVVGFCAPLFIPLVISSNLATAWKSALAGALALGVPEVMMVGGAAVMGKQGFGELKRLFGRILRAHGPPHRVSRVRYRIGLVMFALPLLAGWLGPYLLELVPDSGRIPLWGHLGGDLLFVASFLVLGGEFWGKLQALFVHGARAVMPGSDHGSGKTP